MVGSVWVAANRRKIGKNRKKNRCKWGKCPIITDILPPLPDNYIKQNNGRKTKNKSQPPSGNLPSSSVPKPSRSQGSGISPTRPSWRRTPAGSPTPRLFMRLWEGIQNWRETPNPAFQRNVVASRAVWAQEDTPSSWETSAPAQGCSDWLGSNPDSRLHQLCEYESISYECKVSVVNVEKIPEMDRW